jgi:hypothetical protein
MHRSAGSMAFGLVAWKGWRLILLYIQGFDCRSIVQRDRDY